MNSFTGLSSDVISKVLSIINLELAHKINFKVYVFGSRSKNTYRKYSDLDLWLESEPGLNQSEISKLYTLFEDSDLPIKVDIVSPENCLKEYFDKINTEKILLFKKK